MCMMIAAQSASAWLQSQERMMRAWRDELLFSGDCDPAQIEHIDAHCRWLAEEVSRLSGRDIVDARP
jgi:hypothetical protein